MLLNMNITICDLTQKHGIRHEKVLLIWQMWRVGWGNYNRGNFGHGGGNSAQSFIMAASILCISII